jgi:hypothetical protein
MKEKFVKFIMLLHGSYGKAKWWQLILVPAVFILLCWLVFDPSLYKRLAAVSAPEWASLITALASLLWPIVVFVLVYVFRADIKSVLVRLRKGKILGTELELGPELRDLREEAAALTAQIIQPTEDRRASDPLANREIIELAAHSPKVALMIVSAEIEKQAREILAVTGNLTGDRPLTLSKAISELGSAQSLPSHVTGSLRAFLNVRNRVVHGVHSDDDATLRALDSGLVILRALAAIPRETFTIVHADLAIYSDPKATTQFPEGTAVVINALSPGGIGSHRKIFATTRAGYQPGMRVSWEWSQERKWGPAWYREPETGSIVKAWDGSADFIGRPLNEINDFPVKYPA